jgi:hypothetical protein
MHVLPRLVGPLLLAVLSGACAPAAPAAPELRLLLVSPQGSALTRGATARFTAQAVQGDGALRPMTDAVVWSVADGAVASVSNAAEAAGQVRALEPGRTEVRATDPETGLSAAAPLEVVRSEQEVQDAFASSLPVTLVPSVSPQTPLYTQTGNPVRFGATNLGAQYTVEVLSATGAVVAAAGEPNAFVITPRTTSVQLQLRASNAARSQDFTLTYPVREAPIALVSLQVGTRQVNLTNGEAAPGPRSLTASVTGEFTYLSGYPADATYRVNLWSIFLMRGSRAVVSLVDQTAPTVNTSALVVSAQPGDRILVQVEGVERRNHLGEWLPAPNFAPALFNIPIT